MYILGISAYYHDSAACIIKDGRIIAAAQEERFSRRKHDSRFPKAAVAYCLREAGIATEHVDYVAFYEQHRLKFDRLLKTYWAFAPRGFLSYMRAMPLWLTRKLWIPRILRRQLGGYRGPIIYPEHHQSHAASAFYPSPFRKAAFLTMDGVGEWATTSFGVGDGNRISIKSELHFPHSLGLLYSAFTYYTGFKVNSGEYKVMGLAPYGRPVYADLIFKHLIDLKDDGSFRLNMAYFNYCTGFTMTNERFHRLFNRAPRKPESPITQMDMDLARSIQVVTEEVMLRIGRHVHKVTGARELCMSGGVALNCVGNGRLFREGPFDRIWIQPAAGDAGSALGAALFVWHETLGNPRSIAGDDDLQAGSYLGPAFADADIGSWLDEKQYPHTEVPDQQLAEKVAELIEAGNVVGWFQGRMEFGPRALGGRSILGDPRSPKMQSVMNLKIKYRESFRPFAPAVLQERAGEWFEMNGQRRMSSPYMLMVTEVTQQHRRPVDVGSEARFGLDKLKVQRSEIPAVTHVDYSARIQTVQAKTSPRFHALIDAFYRRTGCPVLINTSFNVRGEPIVATPEDAYRCFMRTEMDYLVLGTHVLEKSKQPPLVENRDWQKEFQLD